MLIWLALVIPILTIVILNLLWKKHVVWWESLILFGVVLLAIAISKVTVEKVGTSDTEYLGSYIAEATYYEDWNELVAYECGSYVTTGKTSVYVPKTCYRVDYHSEYWEVESNTGQRFRITEAYFNDIVSLFGNKSFIDMRRNSHTNDGDAYRTFFPDRHSWDEVIPLFISHRYENRLQAAKSVFNFAKVDTSIAAELFQYPEINNTCQRSILSKSNIENLDEQETILSKFNGFYGKTKELRIFFLIFEDKPLEYGGFQEDYWLGGNKNEFIVCLSIDGNKNVQWCKVISWCENEDLKVNVRNTITQQKPFNLQLSVSYAMEQTLQFYERKKFEDFNYLTVEPSIKAIVIVYLIALALSIGVGIMVVKNGVN